MHLLLPAREFAAVLRANGTNAVIDLDIEGTGQLALTKQVGVHPIRSYIEHVDLLVIKRGEKVTVEVNVVIEGDAASGTLVVQDARRHRGRGRRTVDPRAHRRQRRGVEAGTAIHAGSVTLPEGVTLTSDPELLVVAVNEAPQGSDEGDADEAAADEAAE